MGMGSEIRDPEKTYSGSGSRGQKGTGSRIRIRNTAIDHVEETYQKRPMLFAVFRPMTF
jgi:hypothetical protein